jgi:hypothetical protein
MQAASRRRRYQRQGFTQSTGAGKKNPMNQVEIGWLESLKKGN